MKIARSHRHRIRTSPGIRNQRQGGFIRSASGCVSRITRRTCADRSRRSAVHGIRHGAFGLFRRSKFDVSDLPRGLHNGRALDLVPKQVLGCSTRILPVGTKRRVLGTSPYTQ
jgi:hypothetical protein